MKTKIFNPNQKLIIFSIVLYIINILIILQLIPVFESQSFGAEIINLIVSPPNFIFEDLIGLSSTALNFTILPSGPPFSYRLGFVDLLTWILQFVYDYIIAAIILYLKRDYLK
jgi:hypothetical protein